MASNDKLLKQLKKLKKKKQILEFIEENEIDVDVDSYTKVAELRTAVEEALEEEEEDDLDGEDETEDITYEDVMEMSKDELVELIEDEELDVKYTKKTKAATLAAKVAEELGLEEEEEDGDEDEDGDDISADDVLEMNKNELKALIKDRELETDPAEYKTAKKLQQAVIEELGLGDEEEEDEDEEAEDDNGGEADITDLENRIKSLETRIAELADAIGRGKGKTGSSASDKEALKRKLLAGVPYSKRDLADFNGRQLKMLGSAMGLKTFGVTGDTVRKAVALEQKKAKWKKKKK